MGFSDYCPHCGGLKVDPKNPCKFDGIECYCKIIVHACESFEKDFEKVFGDVAKKTNHS